MKKTQRGSSTVWEVKLKPISFLFCSSAVLVMAFNMRWYQTVAATCLFTIGSMRVSD